MKTAYLCSSRVCQLVEHFDDDPVDLRQCQIVAVPRGHGQVSIVLKGVSWKKWRINLTRGTLTFGAIVGFVNIP